MIYTVTFNPSLDYIITVDNFTMGMTNRTKSEQMLPGGKGINVSIVLKNLGFESTALGFISGFTGDEIAKRIDEMGCKADFTKVENGASRINIKLKNEEGTEINGMGPDIDKDKVKVLLEKINGLKAGDVLVLAGSIPATVSEEIYGNIMEMLADRDIMIIVDATNKLLLNVLKNGPFLVKPNNHELGEIFGIEINDKDNAIKYAYKLQEMGAKNVLVSMAGEGAVLVGENGTAYKAKAPKGHLINAVGAGDSMVAGFIAGYLEGNDLKQAFAMGVSAGSASAFSENLATKDEVIRVYDTVFVEEVV